MIARALVLAIPLAATGVGAHGGDLDVPISLEQSLRRAVDGARSSSSLVRGIVRSPVTAISAIAPILEQQARIANEPRG